MIRRHVLAALAVGVEAGDDDAARETLRRTDWVLRGAARRKLERALVDAALLSGEFGAADADATRHVQRVAALNVAGRIEVDANDRVGVATAYATLAAPTAAVTPVATLIVSTLAAAVVIALVWWVVDIRQPKRSPRPAPPLVAGAFLFGGTPARDPRLETFLRDEITTLVIETDADRRGRDEGLVRGLHVAGLRDAPVIAAHGAGLAAAWRAMIDSLDRWSRIPSSSRRVRDAAAELGRSAQHVSDQFAALGLGYYVQADVLLQRGAHAALFVYVVEQVTYVRAGGQPRRVLGLRRLDRLNLTLALLGRQGDELGDPVVLLDQIDAFVDGRVLPTLYGQPYPLGDASWRATTEGSALSARAGAAIRRELAAALGDRLGDDTAREQVVRRIVTATVRRHEARHGVDIDRDTPLRYPAALSAYLGTPGDDNSRRFLRRTRAELAAYTSQIGNDPSTPQLALWNLASQALQRERWGSAESYAAVVVIEGLARALGIASPPVFRHGQLDRARLTSLAEPLAAQSSETLRMAARKLWIELYAEPMLPIVDLLR